MDIYFIELNEIFTQNKPSLKELQSKVGKQVIEYLLKNKYGFNAEILKDNGKPYIEGNPVYFNISHSKNLVGVVFDEDDVGIDVELIKDRDFKSILKYFKIEKEDISKEEFFQIWTTFEAEYKSRINDKILNFKFNDYMCSVSYVGEKDLCFYKVYLDDEFKIEKMNTGLIEFLKPVDVKIRG